MCVCVCVRKIIISSNNIIQTFFRAINKNIDNKKSFECIKGEVH